jgi:predicted LPLAT superfamily acyltransferase
MLAKEALMLSLCLVALILGSAAGVVAGPAQDQALLAAAIRGDASAVQALLAKGADVNAKGLGGLTALMVASHKGHLDVVQALLAKGADVNAKTIAGWTALIVASYDGHLDMVQELLAKGADVNAKNNDGRTALYYATKSGRAGIRALLVQAGAHVGESTHQPNRGRSVPRIETITPWEAAPRALILAAQSGHLDMVNVVLVNL